jgi:predicted transcriptional regulator
LYPLSLMRLGQTYNGVYHGGVKVEVRATGLKAMREKRGLTQRKLAHDLGISQNYIPAIEVGRTACRAEASAANREILRRPI